MNNDLRLTLPKYYDVVERPTTLLYCRGLRPGRNCLSRVVLSVSPLKEISDMP